MKITFIVFGILVALIAVMMFGAFGLSRFVRWMGWPQDVLAAAGLTFILLTAITITGWRLGDGEDRRIAREKLEAERAGRTKALKPH